MPAVEPVLQVDDGLADEVVRAQQVPVEELHVQDGVWREGGCELEAPAKLLGICTAIVS